VNLNAASSAELQQVPGIGPSAADRILQMRKSYGAFKSVDDLLAIKGLAPKKLEKMRKYLTIGKAPQQSKKPGTAAQAPSVQGKAPPAKIPSTKTTPAQKTDPSAAAESGEP
jgi:competence ComEA-like helix-hairpin-helix protein